MIIRFQLDPTGRVIARRLQRDDAVLAGTKIKAQRESALERIPEDLRAVAASKLDELAGDIDDLERSIRLSKEEVVSFEPDDAVLRLIPLETARSLAGTNYDIDNRVSILGETVSTNLRRPEGDRKGDAARTLDTLVLNGDLSFLKLDSARQWLETSRRWQVFYPPDPIEEEAAERARAALDAARTLGVVDVVDQVRVLNDHFGKMQGLEKLSGDGADPISIKDKISEGLDKVHARLIELLGLANFLWSGDDADSNRNRMTLIGPYIEKIVEISKNASALRMGRGADEAAPEEPPPDESIPEPTPTDAPPPDDAGGSTEPS